MPADVAVEFLTKVDDLAPHNVVFEDADALLVRDIELYHILGEYDMEIPVKARHLTLFVATSKTCGEELLEFLRSSVCPKGYVKGVPLTTKGLAKKLGSKAVMQRFLSGAAKIISVEKFLQIFRCKCLPFNKVKWCCLHGKPDPVMTVFISDSCRFDIDRNIVVGHRSSVTYHMMLLGMCVGVGEKELRPGSRKEPLGYDYRSSMSDLKGDRMPPLKPDGRVQFRLDWDTDGLYHSICA